MPFGSTVNSLTVSHRWWTKASQQHARCCTVPVSSPQNLQDWSPSYGPRVRRWGLTAARPVRIAPIGFSWCLSDYVHTYSVLHSTYWILFSSQQDEILATCIVRIKILDTLSSDHYWSESCPSVSPFLFLSLSLSRKNSLMLLFNVVCTVHHVSMRG